MKFFGLGCGSNKKQVIDSNDKGGQRPNVKPNVKPPKASLLAPAIMKKEIAQDQTCEICKF